MLVWASLGPEVLGREGRGGLGAFLYSFSSVLRHYNPLDQVSWRLRLQASSVALLVVLVFTCWFLGLQPPT